MDCLMGIDLGSTSLKALVYDLDGNCLASGSRPTERFHPHPQHPEWTVWEPEQIWGGTAAAIREAVGKLDNPRRIRAVAVTGMGMDGLPVDAAGQWLYPLISWHDPRTGPQFQWWQEHIGAAKVFAIGGNPLWMINSALRMRWMAENEPEILRRADKWLLIEDFLNFLLTGRRVTDYSMASCTLLFDQRRLAWSEELLGLSGIDGRLLCEVLPSGTPIGTVQAAAAPRPACPRGRRSCWADTIICAGPCRWRCSARRRLERDGHVGNGDDGHSGARAQGRAARGGHDGPGPRGTRPPRRLGWQRSQRDAGMVSSPVCPAARISMSVRPPALCAGVVAFGRQLAR